MFRRSAVYAASLLAVVSGHTTSAEDQGRNQVDFIAKKVDLSQGPNRSEPVRFELGNSTARRTRVLFITKKDCERCEQELDRLRKPGGDFEKLQAAGWKISDAADSHIQIVDSDLTPEVIDLLKAREYPAVACVVDGEIVRSFTDGCTTPLDAWTFGWLLKGVNERPQSAISAAARVETTGNYRLRGNHWTVEGDPNPSKESVLHHLRGANHANSAAPYGAIENWSTEELRSLHDDIHEREGGGVAAAYYGPSHPPAANRSLDAFSGSRKVMGR